MSEEIMNPELSENEVIALRREKLAELREEGNPFPNDFHRKDFAADVLNHHHAKTHDELEAQPQTVTVAGRIVLRRVMGKASFAHIQDMSGRIQLYLQENSLAVDYEKFKKWDLGDIIGASGTLFRTKTGELSVRVSEVRLLTKSLRPLPDKFHGLTDIEARYRQRYLDLITNETTRKTFQIRSAIVQALREFLTQRQFLEVETPMLHAIPGGAVARPFATYHNALDRNLFLRIAPELYLKRLVVGGFERVFEVNRNFRNEGLSTRHNPEFTMLEFYLAYANYEDLINLTEEMFPMVAKAALGSSQFTYQGREYDFAKPFKRMTVKEAILNYNPDLTPADLDDIARAKQVAAKLHIPLQASFGLGKIQMEIFDKTVEEKLLDPTFITAYPTEVSPLARRNDQDPFVTDRFELFIAGREIANGFSELNDAEDQAERFKQQVADKDGGDLEAMHYDADYITALEYGLPPTAGEGIGIDRLVMLLTDSAAIRDVILFPQLRT